MSILAILVGIAVPAISDWSQRAQVRSEAQKYLNILTLARSTAITNNQNVSIQIGAVEADGSIDFDIFVDDNWDGVFDVDDVYIREFDGEATSLILSVLDEDDVVVNSIRFDENGRLLGGKTLTIDVQNRNANLGRLIDINLVGRASVSENTTLAAYY